MAEPGETSNLSVTSDNTVAEIRAYASDHGIDLAGARTKAQMLAAIEEESNGNS